jgi:hypothetical protein
MTPIHRTVQGIKDVVDASEKPLTTGEIANALNLTTQTIRNHINTAIEMGFIKLSNVRYGKAFLYESAIRKQSILPVVRKGEELVILRDVLINLTDDEARKRWFFNVSNPYTIIAAVIQKLFIRAAGALDEDSPTPVALSDLKQFKQVLTQQRAFMQEAINSIDSLLNQSELWNPKEMPKSLLINDDELMDSAHLRSILDRVIK